MHIICDECFKKAQPLEALAIKPAHITPWPCRYCEKLVPANTTHHLAGDTPQWDVCRTLGISTKNCSFFDYADQQRDLDLEFETELQKDVRGLATRLVEWLRKKSGTVEMGEAQRMRLIRLLEALDGLSLWKNNDPREDIYKRADIIVRHPDGRIGEGHVDTKEGWYLRVTFPNNHGGRSIDKWDTTWSWCRLPEK